MTPIAFPTESLLTAQAGPKVNPFPTGFGDTVSPHMLMATYQNQRWSDYRILPFGKLQLAPTALGLHYGQSVCAPSMGTRY